MGQDCVEINCGIHRHRVTSPTLVFVNRDASLSQLTVSRGKVRDGATAQLVKRSHSSAALLASAAPAFSGVLSPSSLNRPAGVMPAKPPCERRQL
jgi:hypothetical protein